MDSRIYPFRCEISGESLADLKRRLSNVRWPSVEPVSDWSQGIPLSYMKEICDYWLNSYDWRRWELRLNQWPQFKTAIDGVDIHFIHARSPHEDALPMIMTHGWPGSIVEFHKVIDPLINPTAHGGNAEDAFHIVCPSLPGFGFSGKPAGIGWGALKIGRTWGELMARLGYSRYVAQGGDWGSVVTHSMGLTEIEHCAAIHTNMPLALPTPDNIHKLTEQERAALATMDNYYKNEFGYAKQQGTRPQTLGYGLSDSPVGQAAWILEKFQAWMDCGEEEQQHPENCLSKDELLDNVMMYWLSNAGVSSARLYWEKSSESIASDPITIPVGCSIFPKEIMRTSRRYAEKRYTQLIYWNELDKGGHFAALEQPDLFVSEIRACFKTIR